MSKTVGFIGLGNMGMPMAEQLIKAGHSVQAFDLSEALQKKAAEIGAIVTQSVEETVKGAEVVITMLPAGPHVRQVYLSEGGLVETAALGTLLIDSSTIDVETSKEVGTAAVAKGLEMIDAPVTGGVMAARVGKRCQELQQHVSRHFNDRRR